MKPLAFEIATQVMVAVAIGIVVVPLIVRRGSHRVWPGALLAALFLFFGSAIAYPYLSTWHWPAQSGGTAAAATGIPALENAAAANPQDPQAWARLALALVQSQRAAQAVEPLENVYRLTDGSNVDMSMLLVDALMMTNDANRPRVNTLVEDILARNPEHPKALYYGAELAFSRGDRATARARWQVLLDRARMETSEEAQKVTRVLEQRIAALAAPGPVEQPASAAQVSVQISVAPALAQRFDDSDLLFVLARVAGERGPPVAVVRRQASELPLTISLSDADAMLATRTLSQFETVEVVARIARGGTPVAQPGDLFGSATIAVSDSAVTSIQIDSIEQ